MSDETRDARERTRQLMMASLDGELSDGDVSDLDRRLAADPELAAEFDKMRKLKEVTDTMGYRKPPDEIWDNYWGSVYNRAERGLAWVLVSIGTLVITGYGTWHAIQHLLRDTETPGFVKIGLLALVLGGLVLLVSVIREKLTTRRRDPYTEVQR